MKLTNNDKEILLGWGHSENDLKQIEEATRKTIYKINGKKRINRENAIELLGRKEYLSGISRSAFHFSASRNIGDTDNTIIFDSSKLFE